MRTVLFVLVAVVLAWAAGGAGAQEAREEVAPAEHVVVISVDGLRPDFYLDPSWPAPVLRGMAEEGAHAEGVTSVFPSSTYPAHTTMMTGALPARHGIWYNTPFEPGGQSGRWYWEYDAIRVPTLWETVAAAGGTAASFSWPATVGAPVRWNVPEIWDPGDYEGRLELVRRHTTPPGFLAELEGEATGRLAPHDRVAPGGGWDQAAWDVRTADMAAYVLARYRPTLLTVHVIRPDGAQHEHGREDPAVRRAVAAADRAVGRIVEAAERAGILDRTAFVVAGDHGFIDTSVLLAPNVWLVEAGLMEGRPDRGEWRATFHTAGGSAFLHLRDPADRESVERVRELLAGLEPGVRRLFRVVERDELDRLGADPRVPLALGAERGVYFAADPTGPPLGDREGGGHGHLPDLHPDIRTGLVAWGAGVRPGAVVPLMGLEDVAPLVAALLGLDFRAPDGVLWRGVLR